MPEEVKLALIIVAIVLAVLLVLFIIYLIVCRIGFNMVFSVDSVKDVSKREMLTSPDKKVTMVYEEEHLKASKIEELSVTSFDGLKLKAHLVINHPESHIYIVSCHGWRGYWKDNTTIGMKLDEAIGANSLYIEQRGHYGSEGDLLSMGWYERLDVVEWCKLIIERDKDAKIILYGVSMGAATVMNAVGEDLPSNVKCAIEDCGFFSTYEQVKATVSKMSKVLQMMLPGFVILSHWKLHTNVRKEGPVTQLKKAKIPMLFIHGDNDDFVPYPNLKKNYDAYPETVEKESVTFPGAAHALSIYYDGEKYFNTVLNFIKKHI